MIVAETSNAIHGDRSVPLSRRPELPDAEWQRFAARLTELADAVAREGLTIAFHHHMGTIVQTEAEIDRLMDLTGPSVALLLDTGHATFAGADAAALARRYASKIWHVHAKDVRAVVCERARTENWSFLRAVLEGVFTVPGDGSVAFERVFRELRNYSGWVILEAEQDPRIADPMTYASLGYNNLRRLLSENAP